MKSKTIVFEVQVYSDKLSKNILIRRTEKFRYTTIEELIENSFQFAKGIHSIDYESKDEILELKDQLVELGAYTNRELKGLKFEEEEITLEGLFPETLIELIYFNISWDADNNRICVSF